MSLFAQNAQAQAGGAVPSNGRLAEFKAGRMTMNGTTVTANPEKGMIYIKNDNSGLMTWNFVNRNTQAEDEPVILFPDEQEFRKCKSAPAESRVFYLKFSTGRREFYWMQEADASKDDDLVAKVNRVMSGLPAEDGGAGASDEMAAIANALGGNVSAEEQAALLQMLGGPAATPAAPRPADNMRTPAVTQTPAAPPALQRPSNLSHSTSTAPAAGQDPMQGVVQTLAREMHVTQATSLVDVLSPSNVEPLLDDDAAVQRLLQHLPEGSNMTAADLRDNIRSPQYTQALATFSAAVQSGDLSLQALGISGNPAAPSGVTGLCEAVQKQEKPDDESSA
eukprot:m.10866 g.10866  ORF g.10866 m.10866 type:complete len:336 (-) comp9698_c0_seq1:42-1049(-)